MPGFGALGAITTGLGSLREQVAAVAAEAHGAASEFERMNSLMGAGNWEKSQLGQLEEFAKNIKSFEGPGYESRLGFSNLIMNEIAKVRAGDESLADAIRTLQGYFNSQYALIQREFTLSSNAAVRQVGQDILQFINAGQIPRGALAIAPVSTPSERTGTPASATTSARTTAGVSSDTRGGSSTTGPGAERTAGPGLPTSAQIVTLGESITAQLRQVMASLNQQGNITPQQTERVLARLREIQVDVRDPAQQQRVLDRLKLIQDDFRTRIDPQHLFQPLIDGQLRPMRQEIRESATKGSVQTRELSMALERLELSGALTGVRQ